MGLRHSRFWGQEWAIGAKSEQHSYWPQNLLCLNPIYQETLGKDFALAISIAAEEFPNGKDKPDVAPSTWHILYTPLVRALNRWRWPSTQRTTRRGTRRKKRNNQTGFCYLNLLNEHSVGKREKRCHFHHHYQPLLKTRKSSNVKSISLPINLCCAKPISFTKVV